MTIEDDVFVTVEDEEDVQAGESTDVRYYLERESFEDSVQVVGRRPKKQVVRRTLDVQEIRTMVGMLRVAHRAARAPAGSDLAVRR